MTVAYFLLALLTVLLLGVVVLFGVLFFRDGTHARALLASEKARLDAQERSDRLMEALARKANVDLVMPPPQQVKLEPSEGWFDRKPQVVIKVPSVKS